MMFELRASYISSQSNPNNVSNWFPYSSPVDDIKATYDKKPTNSRKLIAEGPGQSEKACGLDSSSCIMRDAPQLR